MDSGFTTAIKQEIALTHLDDQIHDWGKATKPRGRRASFHEAATAPRTKSQVRISDTIPPAKDFHLRGLAPLTLFVTWYQRARFRAELLADLRRKPEYLRDIGICPHEATSETTRFFWEPILLRRSPAGCDQQSPPFFLSPSPGSASR
ncbi:uncharacterized protein YjiS (DUF1127 family) [Bradyrhizobium diazoefficiens]|uniref:hypothetical protein n=1 Tax=Bradyrhizobium TaxID=374 RepID=UPI00076615C8|nr:hypothetical protein [Bradyrhizobium diazoefficiens]MBR0861731.1 hypothetical protein [Bradyrhizobium diazoefficiens]MBR0886216.1 hypothetical protein [Bradyrhizobium diazoefficiens]MBR0918147.1 hypothetical protein [Bradyrhizobium diazoefficiens]